MFDYHTLTHEAVLAAAADIYASNRAYLNLIDGNETESGEARLQRDLNQPPPNGAPRFFRLVAEHGRAVAVLDYVSGYPTTRSAYLGLLMVHGSLHGRGIGSRIVADLSQRLRENGCQRLRLSVLDDNPDAYRFWTRLGFEPIEHKTAKFPTADGVVRKTVTVLEKTLDYS